MKENITIDWTERRCARDAWSALPAGILPTSAAGQAGKGGRGMTLHELGAQYAQTAHALYLRIREVEGQLADISDEGEELQMKYRLRLLRSMYRDTRAVALHLEHYYDHKTRRGQHEADVL